MMILAVHVAPLVSVPIGAAILAALGVYWWRLGVPACHGAGAGVRRVSLAMMAALAVVFVIGLSFVDPEIRGETYLVTWSIAMLGVLVVIVVALLDLLNNLRLHREEEHEHVIDAARELISAARAGQNAATPAKADPAAGDLEP